MTADPYTTDAPHCMQLDGADIIILNAARSILKDLAASGDQSRDGGIIAARGEAAEWAIFQMLSAYRIHAEHELSDDQLHNPSPATLAARRSEEHV